MAIRRAFNAVISDHTMIEVRYVIDGEPDMRMALDRKVSDIMVEANKYVWKDLKTSLHRLESSALSNGKSTASYTHRHAFGDLDAAFSVSAECTKVINQRLMRQLIHRKVIIPIAASIDLMKSSYSYIPDDISALCGGLDATG